MAHSRSSNSPLKEFGGPFKKAQIQVQDVLAPPRVLLVQIEALRESDLHAALENDGFQVVTKSTVAGALSCLIAEPFAGLICDLHLPTAGDGFTLVNAMRHIHPDAITMIMSSYPALRESLSTLLPQADEILVTPIPSPQIVKLLKNRLRDPKHRNVVIPEPVANVMESNSGNIIKEWLKRVKRSECLAHVKLSDESRTGHLRTLLAELIERLRTPHLDEGDAKYSKAAIAHGIVRRDQGYLATMLVEESRILQVCIFKALRSNLSAVDLALVLTDVMTIADEVDSQLTQTMDSFQQRAPAHNAVA